MLMGVCGAFLTGDLFNLYVWFEVMLIGSFVLLVLGGGRAQMEAGHQVRHAQPAQFRAVSRRHRHHLRHRAHAEHGRPQRSDLAAAAEISPGWSPAGLLVLLALRSASRPPSSRCTSGCPTAMRATAGGHGDLRGPAHEDRRVCDGARLHARHPPSDYLFGVLRSSPA
jgi:hypothetical protein